MTHKSSVWLLCTERCRGGDSNRCLELGRKHSLFLEPHVHLKFAGLFVLYSSSNAHWQYDLALLSLTLVPLRDERPICSHPDLCSPLCSAVSCIDTVPHLCNDNFAELLLVRREPPALYTQLYCIMRDLPFTGRSRANIDASQSKSTEFLTFPFNTRRCRLCNELFWARHITNSYFLLPICAADVGMIIRPTAWDSVLFNFSTSTWFASFRAPVAGQTQCIETRTHPH